MQAFSFLLLVLALGCAPKDPLPLTLPQAHLGVLGVDPNLQGQIPVYIGSPEGAKSIQLSVDGQAPVDATRTQPGEWAAALPIAGLSEGEHDLMVVGAPSSSDWGQGSVSTTLIVQTGGEAVTLWDSTGNAGTPRLQLVGNQRLLTWADRREANPQCWMQPLDGAGRLSGDRIRMTDPSSQAYYCRVEVSETTACVLYQSLGGPYTNHLRLTDLDGRPRFADIELGQPNGGASFGGDLALDGEDCHLTWRENASSGSTQVYWAKINTQTGDLLGPVLLAEDDPLDDQDDIEPFSFVHVEVDQGKALVSYRRGEWNSLGGMGLPRAQYVVVDESGQAGPPTLMSSAQAWDWHWESHLDRVGDTLYALWTSDDLTNAQSPTPTEIRAAPVTAEGVGPSMLLVQDQGTRGEPQLFALPGRETGLVWIDQRSYADPGNPDPAVDLRIARLGTDWKVSQEYILTEGVLFPGLTLPTATAVEGGILATWLDLRQSNTLNDPRTSLYTDMIWY